MKSAAHAIDFHGATVGDLGYGYLVIDFYSYKVKTKVFHVLSAQSTIVTEYDLFALGCNISIEKQYIKFLKS